MRILHEHTHTIRPNFGQIQENMCILVLRVTNNFSNTRNTCMLPSSGGQKE